ncbi:MAG: class I SAM-dependent methyltransferase [Nitrososphaeria archaeon]
MNEPLPRLDEALKVLTEEKIMSNRYLDLGCGDGSITKKVAEIVKATHIYGVDLNSNALSKAKNKGIKVFRLDLSKDSLPFDDGSIDLVSAFEVMNT